MNLHAFMFGLAPSVDDSAFIDSATAYQRVGHNTGNLAFHFAIANQLGLTKRIDWSASPEQIDAMGETMVIPCANQVGEHQTMGGMGEKLSKVSAKIVAIGLGAQSSLGMAMPNVPEGTKRWLQVMAEHAPSSAPNISVRGHFTQRVMEDLGLGDKSVVLGCPTLFLNPAADLGKQIESRASQGNKRICVVSGHYQWSHLSKLEASLAQIATESGGSYVMQSPLEMVALGRGDLASLDEEFLASCRDYCRPGLTIEEFSAWSLRHAISFFNVPAWMEHMRRFDLVIGARIHGVMLALQAGIPAICIAHDSRTLELCETMKVPFLQANEISNGIEKKLLDECIKGFDWGDFDHNRWKLSSNYTEFLSSNLLESNYVERPKEGG